MAQTVMVTGADGFIGSHLTEELVKKGEKVKAFCYYNSFGKWGWLDTLPQDIKNEIEVFMGDIRDPNGVRTAMKGQDVVYHLAALIAIPFSYHSPDSYVDTNIKGTLNVLNAMKKYGVKNFVFSSSATVYGDPASVPIREDFPVGATTNPYGATKVMNENILTDICKADPTMNVALLRYFNPIGAHESGLIGEDPNGIPNNLVPYIAKVAVGKLEKVHVFGNDYPTPDGTGVLAGLTNVCDVVGYEMVNGVRTPSDGKLIYRGIDVERIVQAAYEEDRFMFEEVIWLLLFGSLPTKSQLARFGHTLEQFRELPENFVEDMIMKAPSPNIMNKMARSVLALYSYDDNPDELTLPNIMRQSIALIASMPSVVVNAYQVKKRVYDKQSMYLHLPQPGQSTAEHILST